MTDQGARQRIEAWAAARATGLEQLGYRRESRRGAGSTWHVRIELRGSSPGPSLIVIEASAADLEGACSGAIQGLGEYGIDVP